MQSAVTINPYTAMTYKVDWLSFWYTPENSTKINSGNINLSLLTDIGYDVANWEESHGRFFYNYCLSLNRYVFAYFNQETDREGNPLKTNTYIARNNGNVLCMFSGQGTTDLAKKLAKKYNSKNYQVVWLKFFKYLKKIGAHITRIDLALDDYHGVLDFDVMERKLNAGEFRSSKKSFKIFKQSDNDGNPKGRTIYIGQPRAKVSKNGNYFVRFYDKYAEYQEKHAVMPKEVEDVTTGGGSHTWQRYELQLNKGKAQHFADEVMANGEFGETYMAVMRNVLEFLDRPKRIKNKNRWPVVSWWKDFLAGAGKSKLGDPERDLDLGRLLRWIRVAVVPSLHLLEDLGKQKHFDIYGLIKSCKIDQYQKKQERLLNTSLEFSQEEIDYYLRDFLRGYGKYDI